MTFRIYVWDSTASTDKGTIVDNIMLTSVPEPGSVGLLSVGALMLVRRRQRRA